MVKLKPVENNVLHDIVSNMKPKITDAIMQQQYDILLEKDLEEFLEENLEEFDTFEGFISE